MDAATRPAPVELASEPGSLASVLGSIDEAFDALRVAAVMHRLAVRPVGRPVGA